MQAKASATGSIEDGDNEIITDDEELIVKSGNSFSTSSRNSMSRPKGSDGIRQLGPRSYCNHGIEVKE